MKYLLTLLWLLDAIAAQAQEYTGHVADKEDGAAVAGAIVTGTSARRIPVASKRMMPPSSPVSFTDRISPGSPWNFQGPVASGSSSVYQAS